MSTLLRFLTSWALILRSLSWAHIYFVSSFRTYLLSLNLILDPSGASAASAVILNFLEIWIPVASYRVHRSFPRQRHSHWIYRFFWLPVTSPRAQWVFPRLEHSYPVHYIFCIPTTLYRAHRAFPRQGHSHWMYRFFWRPVMSSRAQWAVPRLEHSYLVHYIFCSPTTLYRAHWAFSQRIENRDLDRPTATGSKSFKAADILNTVRPVHYTYIPLRASWLIYYLSRSRKVNRQFLGLKKQGLRVTRSCREPQFHSRRVQIYFWLSSR